MDLALNNLQWLIYHKTKPNIWFIVLKSLIQGIQLLNHVLIKVLPI